MKFNDLTGYAELEVTFVFVNFQNRVRGVYTSVPGLTKDRGLDPSKTISVDDVLDSVCRDSRFAPVRNFEVDFSVDWGEERAQYLPATRGTQLTTKVRELKVFTHVPPDVADGILRQTQRRYR